MNTLKIATSPEGAITKKVSELNAGETIVGTLTTFKIKEIRKTIEKEMVNIYNEAGDHILYNTKQEVYVSTN